MSRETDWHVFEKAVEITASAVRGTMSGQGGQEAGFVGDVFRAVHKALHDVADEMPSKEQRAGFASGSSVDAKA
jgi:hypothetical protein